MSQENGTSFFDQVVDRHGTNCYKWDYLDRSINVPDLIHVGCADMDFKIPETLAKRLHELVDHGVFGYTAAMNDFFAAIQRYYYHNHQLNIPRNHILFSPRINIACGLCTEAFIRPYENALIHSPSYPPLRQAVVENGRQLIEVPLDYDQDTHAYSITLESLEKAVTPKSKMMILVNPQNPTTRVFSEQELLTVCEFCEKHDLILFVDEIHADLCRKDVKFTSILHMPEKYHQRIILASSPAKSFNIPGLVGSFIVIPNQKLREIYQAELSRVGEHNPNAFFSAALINAYTECDDYLVELRPYLDANEKLMAEAFKEIFPECHVTKREGSYLLWVDMRKCFDSEESLKKFFFEQARVAVYLGGQFGKGSELFVRFNLGAPRATMEQIISRLKNAKAGRPYNAS